jgi:hypothetical protein
MSLYRTSSVLHTSECAEPIRFAARGANQSYPRKLPLAVSPIVRSVIERR